MVEAPGDIDTAWAAMSFKILNIESVMRWISEQARRNANRAGSWVMRCQFRSGRPSLRW